MDLTALWVVAGGVVLAAGVNFYVFSPRRQAVVATKAPAAPAVAAEPEREVEPPLSPGAAEMPESPPVAGEPERPPAADPTP